MIATRQSAGAAVSFAALLLLPAGLRAAGNCDQNIPIRMQFIGGPDRAIQGDSAQQYQHGVDSVSALIHLCSGTTDATLNLNTSKRTLLFNFPQAVPDSSLSGAYPLNGKSFSSRAFVNIQNLLFRRDPLNPTFTTRALISFDGPDRREYRLRFTPSLVDALTTAPPAGTNSPNESSVVKVTWTAGNCATGLMDSWRVTGLNPNTGAPNAVMQLGTVHYTAKSQLVHAGQYSMPFEILITAMRCF